MNKIWFELLEKRGPHSSCQVKNQTHPKSNMTQLIPFTELTGGTESVRFTVINGGTYMSIRDIIMAVCKKTAHDASDTWQDIPDEKKSEVAECLRRFQFPGQGQRAQPVITLEGALKLIMWLPGEMAKDYRSRACGILTRFLGGDSTLVEEIEANAASDAPIHVLAREALTLTPQQELEARELKRLELRERIARVETLEAEVRHKRVETQRMQKEEALSLEREEHLIKDCRLRVLLRANLMNCLQQDARADGGNLLLTDGVAVEVPKTVQRILQEMGHDLPTKTTKAIGRAVADKFRDRHGHEADKVEMILKEGQSVRVNAYATKDHDLVQEAFEEYYETNKKAKHASF